MRVTAAQWDERAFEASALTRDQRMDIANDVVVRIETASYGRSFQSSFGYCVLETRMVVLLFPVWFYARIFPPSSNPFKHVPSFPLVIFWSGTSSVISCLHILPSHFPLPRQHPTRSRLNNALPLFAHPRSSANS